MPTSQREGVPQKPSRSNARDRGPANDDGAASAPRRRWLVGLAVGAVVILAVAGAWWQREASARWRAQLPPMPDLARQPAELGAAIHAAEAQALATRQPGEPVATLARLYHANGYAKEAEACWALLRSAEPTNPRWCYYLADLRANASDSVAMAALLKETVKLAPDYAPARLKLAALELKTGQSEAAARDYQRRLELVPADPYARLGLARLAVQNGRSADARVLIEQIVEHDPAFAPAHNLYAEILAATGDADGAARQRFLGRLAGRFREADDPWLEEIQNECYDPSRLTVLAAIEDMTNHGDHGVALLERAIRVAPEDPRTYGQLGNVYLHLGEPAKAIEQFARGAKLPNAAADLYANFSQAYLANKQPEPALQIADQGLALTPNAAELHTARANALDAAGRHEDAIAAYRRAVECAPTVCEMHFNLGNALLQAGRQDEGRAALQRALALEPGFPKALLVLGQAEMDAGRLESAEQYIRPLYKNNPGLVSARRLMTWWCLKAGVAAAQAGHMDEAERDLREGVAISPEQPELQGRLGLLCAQQGRFEEAKLPLEAYRQLKPDEPMAALFLGQVYGRLNRAEDARRLLKEAEQLARRAGDSATLAKTLDAQRQLDR